MSRFIVTSKLTLKECIEALPDIEKWFRDNPSRKVCRTETFTVRRGYIATDLLKHTNLIK